MLHPNSTKVLPTHYRNIDTKTHSPPNVPRFRKYHFLFWRQPFPIRISVPSFRLSSLNCKIIADVHRYYPIRTVLVFTFLSVGEIWHTVLLEGVILPLDLWKNNIACCLATLLLCLPLSKPDSPASRHFYHARNTRLHPPQPTLLMNQHVLKQVHEPLR